MAKAALEALTRCLAAELGADGVRANIVSPGLVETGGMTGVPE
jgi:3-oxoacyl-[acyl-carrier protein] reductase